MGFEIDIGFASLAGRKKINEDFCAAMRPAAGQEAMGCVVAIADGVSTGGKGQEAAQTTVTSLVRDYHDTPQTWDTTDALDRIIGAQNSWLYGLNRSRYPVSGLTTLTAVVLRDRSYALAHVGDTRAYLLREGSLRQLTADHVLDVPGLRHQLLRCVGAEDALVVDHSLGDLLADDVFLLLSDGVHGSLNDERLKGLTVAALAAGRDAQALSRHLVDEALSAGTSDNVTAVVMHVQDGRDAGLQVDRRKRFEPAAELSVGLQQGAFQPPRPRGANTRLARGLTWLWKLALGVALLLYAFLVSWLLYLPR